MKSHNALWMLAISALLLTPLTYAQQCPAGLASPSMVLDGTTWSFLTQTAEFAFGAGWGSATVGKFSARQTGPTQGTISYTITIDNGGAINRLANSGGKFIVYPDCSGGELLFNSGGYAVQYEFVFVNGYTELYMTADSLIAPGTNKNERGTAKLSAPSACPAGVNPLSIIDGSTWGYHAESALYLSGNATSLPGAAQIGTFKPTMKNNAAGVPAGVLTAVVTTNISGVINRLAPVSGRYTIYPDCSGGEIMIMVNALAIQYEFVFIDNSFKEMYLLSDVTTTLGTKVLAGHAKKF